MTINVENTIDFDIVDDCIVSKSLLDVLLSELNNNDTDYYFISNIILLLRKGFGNIYHMSLNKEFHTNSIIDLSMRLSSLNMESIIIGYDRALITVNGYYKHGENAITNSINRFSLSNVKISIEEDIDLINVSISGILSFIEYKNTSLLTKKLERIRENSIYGILKSCSDKESVNKTIMSELSSYMESHNTLKNPAKFFKVKDARVSKDRTIIFWEDGTKTIIKKAEVEKEFDLEKAIMAAFTRRALSFGHTAKERSVDETIDNIAGMINDHLDYEEGTGISFLGR